MSAQMCPALADILSGRATSLQGEKQLILGHVRITHVVVSIMYSKSICAFFLVRLSTVTALINWRRTL